MYVLNFVTDTIYYRWERNLMKRALGSRASTTIAYF